MGGESLPSDRLSVGQFQLVASALPNLGRLLHLKSVKIALVAGPVSNSLDNSESGLSRVFDAVQNCHTSLWSKSACCESLTRNKNKGSEHAFHLRVGGGTQSRT